MMQGVALGNWRWVWRWLAGHFLNADGGSLLCENGDVLVGEGHG